MALRKALVFVFLGSLLLRALYFLEHTATPGFAVPLLDQKYYVLFAEAIAGGKDLSRFGGFRPILYPAFLALFIAPFGSAGTVVAVAAQHLLGACTAVLVGCVAARLARGSTTAALAGGLLYGFAGPVLFLEGELLIESTMPLLVALTLLAAAHATESTPRPALLWWTVAGALAALTAQARPNMLLVYPAFGLLAALLWLLDRRWVSLVPLAALPVILVVQVLFGFVNQAQSGRFQLVTSAGGINFYVGNNRTADGMIPRVAYSTTYEGEYRDSIAEFSVVEYRRAMAEAGLPASDDPNVISRYWTERTVEEIRADPVRWVGLMVRKVLLTLANSEIPNVESFAFARAEESLLLRLNPIRWALILTLLPAGCWLAWRRGSRALLTFLVLFLLLYAASFILFFVNGRFRIPLWPAACAIAGVGVAYLIELRRPPAVARAPLLLGAALGLVSLGGSALVPRETFAEAFFFRSLAHYERRAYAEALRDVEATLRLEPPTGDRLMHAGNVQFALGDFEAAIASYNRALALEPGEPRTHNNIGAALEELGRYREALAAYQRALDIAPRHRTALVNAALLELRGDMIDQAAAHLALAQSVESTGNDAALLAARGLLALAQGDRVEAARLLDQAHALAPAATTRLVEQSSQPIDLGP
jgi:tetratricopeptide (TPR) repeat protein